MVVFLKKTSHGFWVQILYRIFGPNSTFWDCEESANARRLHSVIFNDKMSVGVSLSLSTSRFKKIVSVLEFTFTKYLSYQHNNIPISCMFGAIHKPRDPLKQNFTKKTWHLNKTPFPSTVNVVYGCSLCISDAGRREHDHGVPIFKNDMQFAESNGLICEQIRNKISW